MNQMGPVCCNSWHWLCWQKRLTDWRYWVVFGVLPRRITPYLCVVDDFGTLARVGNDRLRTKIAELQKMPGHYEVTVEFSSECCECAEKTVAFFELQDIKRGNCEVILEG